MEGDLERALSPAEVMFIVVWDISDVRGEGGGGKQCSRWVVGKQPLPGESSGFRRPCPPCPWQLGFLSQLQRSSQAEIPLALSRPRARLETSPSHLPPPHVQACWLPSHA